jgi:serine protease AprX
MMNLMKLILSKKTTSKSGIHRSLLPIVCLFVPVFFYPSGLVQAQVETAIGKYRVEFTDKSNSPYSLTEPRDFLSERSILRRQKQHIAIDSLDLPVNPAYITQVVSTGAEVLNISKWFNAITIGRADTGTLQKIMKLPFVGSVGRKKMPFDQDLQVVPNDKWPKESNEPDYGYSARQIMIHKGDKLHAMGYTGAGMQIAVIDAGFDDVDKHEAFRRLWEENRIISYHDFVDPGSLFFRQHTHGKTVLSVIGGYIPGILIGTAPDAGFYLLRSEDAATEYPIEEDNWIAAAEYADSAGADIINTSLGYSTFSDPTKNHTYADMDGHTTRISRAANVAASRGMLVVVSAGNEGSSGWRYISAPADADSVLAVGAIDSLRIVAGFSSHGPSYDGRVKPDVCAMGVKTFGVGSAGYLTGSNGTSFSAPVISGLAACLWQANPRATAMEILSAIKESADRYTQPDTLYGYGIPDFNLANLILKSQVIDKDTARPFTAFPNPFSSEIYIWLNETGASDFNITLYDFSGRAVYSVHRSTHEYDTFMKACEGLSFLPKGIYLMKIVTDRWHFTESLLKL